MAPTRMLYQDQIDAGVELLDREEPGWALNVNLDRLGMASCRNCVLGQVFGSYGAGIAQLRLNGSGHMYGFDNGSSLARLFGFVTYPILTAGWKTVIESRQHSQAAP